MDRYNRLKLGGEYTKYYITSYSSSLTNLRFRRRLSREADPVERVP